MVENLLNPLNIFILGLGVGFLLAVARTFNKNFSLSLLFGTLFAMFLISFIGFYKIWTGELPVQIFTAGFRPPISINLLFGLNEAFLSAAVNLVGVVGILPILPRLVNNKYSSALYLLLIMGVNGLIFTRDAFNLFVFMEITAITSYGLIAIDRDKFSLNAGFKYMMAGSLASAFYLLGVIFLYAIQGTLNIDVMIEYKNQIENPVGIFALTMLIVSLIIELKPYPINGWGLDVYEATPSPIATLISTVVATGIFYSFYKFIPLLNTSQLWLVASVAIITFFISNLIGLNQNNVKRMLGYSSIAQIGLMLLSLVILVILQNNDLIPYIVGGFFLNHLLAKAALFWLSDVLEDKKISLWSLFNSKPILKLYIIILFIALTSLPPFPGFWAKWHLITLLLAKSQFVIVALILIGSLFEIIYLFRAFGFTSITTNNDNVKINFSENIIIPSSLFLILLFTTGYLWSIKYNMAHYVEWLPIIAIILFYCFDMFVAKIKGFLVLGLSGFLIYYLHFSVSGISLLFLYIFGLGSMILVITTLHRTDVRKGFYPMLAGMITSLMLMLQAKTYLEFFWYWEIMTITSYIIINLGKNSHEAALKYLVFSLVSAFFIMVGFGLAMSFNGSDNLQNLAETKELIVYLFLIMGFFIKLGVFGVHIWVPLAYGEADDDFSPIISAVVSKAGIFGLFIISFSVLRDFITLSHIIVWVGLITAVYGAMMATFQEDVKKLLAYSSMGQVGYIISCIGLMSHLGWVSALYLSVNHLLYKGLIFVAIASVIYRTQTRYMYQMGGLIKQMPISYIGVMIGIIAMSGVPPLTGFGGKWLLYQSLIEQKMYLEAGVAFFASAVAFLYMFRMIYVIFLGQLKLKYKDVKEGPIWFSIPIFILIGFIMVFSVYPQILLNEIVVAVSPIFEQTLIINGSLIQTSIGYWNALIIMIIVGVVFMVPYLWLLISPQKVQKVKQFNIVYAAERPETPELTHVGHNFYAPYKKVFGYFVFSRATNFYNKLSEWTHTLGSFVRGIYTGNGQTYAHFILVFVIIFYFLMETI